MGEKLFFQPLARFPNLATVFGSVTQPYKKPELSQLDRIEHLFKRRQDTQIVAQQTLDRIEKRMGQVCNMNVPTMTLIARPVFAYRPVISPTAIFDLYHTHAYIKRVPGRVCHFHELSDDYFELNEYGIVYYATRLCENEDEPIGVHNFINGIDKLLGHARKLYNACEALVNVEVIVKLENVFQKKLSRVFNSDPISLPHVPVCYTSEVFASTSNAYSSRDLNDPEHQKIIFEELTTQLLWAFNIPTDNENIMRRVRKVIEYRISE